MLPLQVRHPQRAYERAVTPTEAQANTFRYKPIHTIQAGPTDDLIIIRSCCGDSLQALQHLVARVMRLSREELHNDKTKEAILPLGHIKFRIKELIAISLQHFSVCGEKQEVHKLALMQCYKQNKSLAACCRWTSYSQASRLSMRNIRLSDSKHWRWFKSFNGCIRIRSIYQTSTWWQDADKTCINP